jgi:fructose-bisphosphate aldolase class II
LALVTSKEILINAQKKGYAIGAFNANNLEFIQAIVEAAEEENAPVILQISQGAIRYAGLDYATSIAKIAADNAKVPVVLHLDHGTSFEQNVLALRAGFTSLMFDGSKQPYEINVKTTKKIVEIAHAASVPVEAELGRIVRCDDGFKPDEIEKFKTDPKKAKKFVEETNCDSLAIAVGSVHGMRNKQAILDIERIKKIRKEVDIPLVSHGSSGVNLKSLKKGIKAGLCKVNVATALNLAFLDGIKEAINSNPNVTDFRLILGEGKKKLKDVVKHYIKFLGSSGKA